METIKPKKISNTDKENARIAKEIIAAGGATEIPYSEEEKQGVIDEKTKKMIRLQKDYRLGEKDNANAIAGLHYQKKQIEYVEQEINELEIQSKNYDTYKNIVQWNGIQYPHAILHKFVELKKAEVDSYKTAFNRDIEKMVDITNYMQRKKDELKSTYKFTDDEVKGVLDGKYVKELKTE